LDFDAKRIHYSNSLFHATEGWVSSTSGEPGAARELDPEKDRALPRRCRLAGSPKCQRSHTKLPLPGSRRRRISMHRRSGETAI